MSTHDFEYECAGTTARGLLALPEVREGEEELARPTPAWWYAMLGKVPALLNANVPKNWPRWALLSWWLTCTGANGPTTTMKRPR